jgi:TRAP transporter TAXI family solute receptor
MSVKKYFKSLTLASFVATFFLGAFMPQSNAEDTFVTIGTGGVTGVYYPAGGAICRLVNRSRKDHGIRCSVESTGGSIYNLNALEVSNLDMAVVQSDWQYHAYEGTGPFAGQEPRKNLRSLFSLHTEVFTIAVRSDAGIKTLDDLVGKRVNIGNPGSGQRATMEVLMAAKGWTKDSFKLASELKASEQPQAVCDNKIDAMIYASGHPNGAIQEVTTSCKAKLINITGKEVSDLVNKNSYYSFATIPGGMYVGNPKDIKSFGVTATISTTSSLPDDVAYEVVKAVFDNFDNFKTLHPVFQALNPKDLVYSGNTAPLHPGARRYFLEKGYIKK